MGQNTRSKRVSFLPMFLKYFYSACIYKIYNKIKIYLVL